MANKTLHNANKAKKDEFYTQLTDIEQELNHYWEHFKGKTILCNCDDPRVSNFFFYFYARFRLLGLKRLIATCYKNLNPDMFTQNTDEQAVYCIYDGKDRADDKFIDKDTFIRQNDWAVFNGDGDFRSTECIELLKQADIVVTNPPFSLFREYVSQLIEYDKKFVIIGNKNAITYKEVFKLIKENRLWVGYGAMGIDMLFDVPNDFAKEIIDNKKEGSGFKVINGIVKARAQAVWFTNLDHKKRHEDLILWKKCTPEEFPKYDNYDAINVDKVIEIPVDYNGVMGVPITFLDKYNPYQFEIIDGLNRYSTLDVAGTNKWAQENHLHMTCINGIPKYFRILIRNQKLQKEGNL